MKTDARDERLPVWAKQKLSQLEADVKTWKNRALEAAKGRDSRVFVYDYSDPGDSRGLPDNSEVRFRVNNGMVLAFRLSASRLAVEVRGVGGGIGLIAFMPESGNTASIRVIDWDGLKRMEGR